MARLSLRIAVFGKVSDTVRELRARDPLLFWTGAAMLLALLVVTLVSISDTRLILGINPGSSR